MEISRPVLTDNTTKFFIRSSLKEVRRFKNKYITIIVNILLLLAFFGILGLLLYLKYKGKLTPEEVRIKENQKNNIYLKNYIKYHMKSEKRIKI